MATIAEVLPTIKALPRIDKLRLIQTLVCELAREENEDLFADNGVYPIWTPYDAYAAASTLLNVFETKAR
ncbi:MAG TPA: hypothetical protein PKZ84_07450 [Anaerolineae bacterium]|nr:hypothetical protein [Anaerolineae bacterium]HQI84162.1 hypothetical protein [Anaerolineae bacterium]